MNKAFQQFLSNFEYFLSKLGIEAKWKLENDDLAVVDLSQDGEDFTIGNYADSGASIKWIGTVKIGEQNHDLIKINGVIISANARHVAGWVNGYE